MSNALSLRKRPTWQLYFFAGIQRERIFLFFGIVHEIEAGGVLEDGAGGVDGDGFFKFGADGDGVGAIDGHAHAGDAGAEGGMVHDFAAFVFHFRLFPGVTAGEENIDVGQDVEGDLMGINLLGHRLLKRGLRRLLPRRKREARDEERKTHLRG